MLLLRRAMELFNQVWVGWAFSFEASWGFPSEPSFENAHFESLSGLSQSQLHQAREDRSFQQLLSHFTVKLLLMSQLIVVWVGLGPVERVQVVTVIVCPGSHHPWTCLKKDWTWYSVPWFSWWGGCKLEWCCPRSFPAWLTVGCVVGWQDPAGVLRAHQHAGIPTGDWHRSKKGLVWHSVPWFSWWGGCRLDWCCPRSLPTSLTVNCVLAGSSWCARSPSACWGCHGWPFQAKKKDWCGTQFHDLVDEEGQVRLDALQGLSHHGWLNCVLAGSSRCARSPSACRGPRGPRPTGAASPRSSMLLQVGTLSFSGSNSSICSFVLAGNVCTNCWHQGCPDFLHHGVSVVSYKYSILP